MAADIRDQQAPMAVFQGEDVIIIAAGPAGRLRIAVFATHSDEMLDRLLAENFPPALRAQRPAGSKFTKVVAGRKLWNFDKHNWKTWQDAL